MQHTKIQAAPNPASIAPRDQLARAVTIASYAVERKTSFPVLANLRLKGDGEVLFVTGSDTDLQIDVAILAPSDSRLETTVSSAMLKKILSKAPKCEFASITQQDEQSSIEFDAITFDLASIDADQFPTLKNPENPCKFRLTGTDALEAFSNVAFAISTDEMRYYLNGVYMCQHGSEIDFVATDGHRLAKQTIESPDADVPMPDVIVPRKTISILLKLLSGKITPEFVDIEVSDCIIRFSFDDVTITSKVIEGTFPDYARVIPKDSGQTATMDAKALIASMNALLLVSKKIKLEFANGKACFSANDPNQGSATTCIDAETNFNEEIAVRFNAQYVIDIASEALTGDGTVKFSLNDNSPALVTSSVSGWLAVLMPLKA